MESEIQQKIQIEAVNYSSILMRNNSGALKDETGRLVRYGLGNISKKQNDKIKSSDLIGITEIIITPEMVGQKIGVFTAIEVKSSNWKHEKKLTKKEQAQLNFINWVKSRGGKAGFANSIDNLEEILK